MRYPPFDSCNPPTVAQLRVFMKNTNYTKTFNLKFGHTIEIWKKDKIGLCIMIKPISHINKGKNKVNKYYVSYWVK